MNINTLRLQDAITESKTSPARQESPMNTICHSCAHGLDTGTKVYCMVSLLKTNRKDKVKDCGFKFYIKNRSPK